MNDIILLKQGEIVLKGLNRKYFEQRLVSNVTRRLKAYGDFRVYAVQSTVYVEPQSEQSDMDGAFEALSQVFGVISLTRAAACEKSVEAVAEKAKTYLAEQIRSAASFKVESKRSDKSFPLNSIQISQAVGAALAEAFPETPVDVHNPALTVHVEIRDYAAYVHCDPTPGAGGMPVGSNGTAVTLLSGGIDSPVASYMIAKRGIHLIPVHFYSFPYTGEASKEKVIELARRLTSSCGRLTIEIVPFTHIQESIRDACPEAYFTLIMRRFMMRIAQRVAEANGADAIVTGENLGQVASQTMKALSVTENVVSLPVLRPLIGFDKEEIVRYARRIGTFETSILPYEDCCTVFTPRRPKISPTLRETEEAEQALDTASLIDEAYAGIERVKLSV